MENLNIILLLILVCFSLVLGSYFLQILKQNNLILEKLNHFEKGRLDSREGKNLFPVEYGLTKGEEIPNISVMNFESKKVQTPVFSEEKENLILITGIGCQPCEEVLFRMASYDPETIEQNITLLSFDPIQGITESSREKHLKLVENVNKNQKLIINEQGLDDLKVNTFPTLIRVDKNKKVVGTYSGHYESMINHLNFK